METCQYARASNESSSSVSEKSKRRPTHQGEITTQAGPKFATKQGQTGASSGDHTQISATFVPKSRSDAQSSNMEYGNPNARKG